MGKKFLLGKIENGRKIITDFLEEADFFDLLENLIEDWSESEEDSKEFNVAKKFEELLQNEISDLKKYEEIYPFFLGEEVFIGEIVPISLTLKEILINGEKYELECVKI